MQHKQRERLVLEKLSETLLFQVFTPEEDGGRREDRGRWKDKNGSGREREKTEKRRQNKEKMKGGERREERREVIERKQCRGQVWLQMNRLSERERQLVIPIRAHAL